jgi:hypothetical protein
MASVVKVKGLREVTRSLKQYAGATEDLKEANANISSKVSKDAISIAPKSSGTLASTIRGNRAVQKVQLKAGGARVPYAGVIEYGWPARNIEAQPYLRKAAWDNMAFVIQQFDANLEDLKRKYISGS